MREECQGQEQRDRITMLQTRIRVPQRLHVVAVTALCVAVCVLTAPVKAQVPDLSCSNVVNLVRASGQSQVSMNDIFESLNEGKISTYARILYCAAVPLRSLLYNMSEVYVNYYLQKNLSW